MCDQSFIKSPAQNPACLSHTCDVSLFRRGLPVLDKISLFGISEFSYMSYTSRYFEFWISLLQVKKFLLCLSILPIWKRKSPCLASQVYHMYGLKCLDLSLKFHSEKYSLLNDILARNLEPFMHEIKQRKLVSP